MNTVYFQPPGMNPKYCEAGIILETDPNYIHYIDEPCKVLISEVKIIEEENVTFDKKSRLYQILY
jgi:biotin carboxylase